MVQCPTYFYIMLGYEQKNPLLLHVVCFVPLDSSGNDVKLRLDGFVVIVGVIKVKHFGAASNPQYLARWVIAGC